MVRTLVYSRRRGMTLVETVVSTAIMALMFTAFAGVLVFASRSLHTLHKQSRSQSRCSASMERVANLMRNAMEFAPCSGHSPSDGPVPCIRFALPTGTDVYNPRWGEISFTPAPAAGRDDADPDTLEGELSIRWTDNADSEEVPSAWSASDLTLAGVTDFAVEFRSSHRVMLKMAFYNPSMLNRASARMSDNVLTTEVSAKNHYLLRELNDENLMLALRF